MIFHECKGEVENEPFFFFKETHENPQIQAYLNEKKEWLDKVRMFARSPLFMGSELLTVVAVQGSYHEWLREKLAKTVSGEDLFSEIGKRTGMKVGTGTHTHASENTASTSTDTHAHVDSPFIPKSPTSTPSPSPFGNDSPFIPNGSGTAVSLSNGLPVDASKYKPATEEDIPLEVMSSLPPIIQQLIASGEATVMIRNLDEEV